MEVTGFVEDPRTCFERVHLAVLPLFEGAGVKVKVLKCLAAGLPVLTTPIGSEGIEALAHDGLLVQEPVAADYARRLIELLNAPARLAELSRSANDWSERQKRARRDQLLAEPVQPATRCRS